MASTLRRSTRIRRAPARLDYEQMGGPNEDLDRDDDAWGSDVEPMDIDKEIAANPYDSSEDEYESDFCVDDDASIEEVPPGEDEEEEPILDSQDDNDTTSDDDSDIEPLLESDTDEDDDDDEQEEQDEQEEDDESGQGAGEASLRKPIADNALNVAMEIEE